MFEREPEEFQKVVLAIQRRRDIEIRSANECKERMIPNEQQYVYAARLLDETLRVWPLMAGTGAARNLPLSRNNISTWHKGGVNRRRSAFEPDSHRDHLCVK